MTTQNGPLPAWANKIIRGQVRVGLKLLAYGPPGVGKTSLGKNMPRPVSIDYDKGSNQAGTDRIPGPTSWGNALALVRAIGADPGPYKTLVIDTLDPMEELCIAHVCRQAGKKSLSDFGGFADGYSALRIEWRVLFGALDTLVDRGVNVCLLSHSTVRQVQDPQIGSYDLFTTALQKTTWMVTHRWCDIVGFCTFDAARIEEGKNKEKRVVYTGERYMKTTSGTGYVAKERFGLPKQIPLSWEVLDAHIQRFYSSQPPEVAGRIRALAKGYPELLAKAEAFLADPEYANDARRLLEVEQALRDKLETLNEEATASPAPPVAAAS